MRRLLLPLVLTVACKNDIVLDQTNVAPTAEIQSPEDGAVYTIGQTVELQGLVADGNGLGDVTNLTWSSSVDGVLVTTPVAELDAQGVTRWAGSLSAGNHTIALIATDSQGERSEDAVSLVVQEANQQPAAEISSPQDFDTFQLGATIDFLGVVYDPNQPPDTLQVTWEVRNQVSGASLLSTSGTPGATGATTARITNAPLGSFLATVTVTDQDGNHASDSVVVAVSDPDDEDNDGDNWTTAQGDCDDTDPQVFPNNPEACDLVDNDCNGVVDDKDLDGDLHIDENCGAYTGALPDDDCDDSRASVHPAAPELTDGIDNDCNGSIDDGTPAFDSDGDCWCIGPTCVGSSNPACVTTLPGDCNDTDPLLNQDDLDADGYSSCENDCDDSDPLLNPADGDGDGFSSCNGDCNDANPALRPSDVDGDGFSTCAGDCNDIPLDCGADCYPSNTAPDVCDGKDQDCDGTVDEDASAVWYHDADGDGWTSVTDTVAACADPDGAGTAWVAIATQADCDDSDPLLNHDDDDNDGVSTCEADCNDGADTIYPGAPELCDSIDNDCNLGIDDVTDVDNDTFTTCEGDCNDAVATTYPGAPDAPDPAYTDSNCDGIDGDLATAVFVDAQQGSNGNTGGPTDPYLTLAVAMAAAGSGGTVLVSTDQAYNLNGGTLTLLNGVSVYGGYSYLANWARDADKALVFGGTTAIYASGVNSQTTIAQLDVEAASNTAPEGTSYGARILDSNGLRFIQTKIEARSGGPGAPGTSGGTGANGSPGVQGNTGCDGCSGAGEGGAGGSGGGSCPDGGAGGRGGYGDNEGSDGNAGGGTNPGAAGSPGNDGSGSCVIPGCTAGGPGGTGGTATVSGGAGGGGLGGGAAGGVIADLWRGSIGMTGTAGSCGSGGGGGGGGGGTDCCNDDRGGGGGGGGGAGAGGQPGSGGTAGGGSIAMFLVRSTVHLDGVVLESGSGGPGGPGGQGGAAGSGGTFGAFGGPADDGGRGGNGGAGSSGGAGGWGGGGAGGISYGLYKVSSSRSVGPSGVSYLVGTGGQGGASSSPLYQGATGNSGQEF